MNQTDSCGRTVRHLGDVLEMAKALGVKIMNGRIIEPLVLLLPWSKSCTFTWVIEPQADL